MDKAQKIKKDIEELDKWIKTNPDSRELKRAIAVKLSLQGWTYQAIAPILNVSLSFIGKWKTQFEDRGIPGLKLSYQGAKSYLDEEQKQKVLSWLQQQEYYTHNHLVRYHMAPNWNYSCWSHQETSHKTTTVSNLQPERSDKTMIFSSRIK